MVVLGVAERFRCVSPQWVRERCFQHAEQDMEGRWDYRISFPFRTGTAVVFLHMHIELPFLLQCFPSLKKVQLPSLSKLPFKSIDQKFMEKSKNQLNNFLQVRKQTTEWWKYQKLRQLYVHLFCPMWIWWPQLFSFYHTFIATIWKILVLHCALVNVSISNTFC